MKNLFKSLVVGALLLGGVGCSDMFKEDLYEINNELDKINQRIDSLCNAVNTNIASLQTIIDVMQDNDYVDSITPIVEGGETVGYEIVFTQSGSVKIYHGKKGETGATGHTPVIGVKQAEDGRWYWTVDGAYLLDGEGDKILAEAIDGEDGATGADGITPQLKVEGDYWYISYDNKATWERLGKATGEAGKDGDSMFQSVNYNDEYVELVLIDGTVLRIPTWASHMLLVDEIAKINSNISAIQAAIEALESNDYVQKVTPVKDEDGNVIGYTLQFAFTGDVTIFHGEDGKDGEDGEDGKDGEDGEDGKDGYTPVIGARQHPDGIWYWTVDGEWLLDTNGNRVKTTGEDGTSGITPELKIQDDYWYVSYDKGQTWTKLGKAKGEDGAAGSAGTAGDAFFKGVDTSDEYYVKFTLADGTVIKIPTWKAYQELADLVDQLNTNFKSLNDIVVGIQNNDYITGYTPIVDPQTNEEIGYTLHFAKSGDITIYHGKTGQDGVAPDISIQEHPKYGLCWTYNGEFIIDPGTGKPVALPSDGKNGKDGVSPKLKIEDGEWWVSYNNGSSWTSLGQATGDTGATGGTGDSFFKSIEPEYAKDANGNILKDSLGKPIVAYIVMTLAGENEGDEIVYKVPTEYVTDDLNKRLAAIETQFSAISTIVNSLMNAEYIKDVVELYEGPALVGYEIVFVKYTIGADGKLTETTRKSTIRNGGAGAAGTVVDAEYDEATDTWYWTLDGKPLVDEDGNYVAINGKDGKPGATPQMRINTETNFWEVSYDGGDTWVSTEVLATGPQGPQGNPGQGGAAGDSFFSNVYKSEDGLYWVFDRTEGEDIMVPTAEAFASLAAKVAALEETSKSIMNLVSGKKYIESCEPFDNEIGTGYHLVLVSVDPQTGETVKEDCYIYDGKDGVTPVVGLRQDEATGDWYWTVDGEDVLVDGKPVKANGPQGIDGPVPSFRIDPANGHLYVTVNGTETDLGRVVGANGSAGESGTNSSIDVKTTEDGKVTITFIGGDGLTSTIEVPSWAAFVELQEMVNDLNANVEALQAAVTALQNNDYVIAVEDVTDEAGEVVGYKLVFAKSGEKVIYHGKKGDKGEDAVAPRVQINPQTNEWEISTDGGQTWTSTGVSAVGPKGDAGATPKFKIENGQWYVSYDNGTTWGDSLGQATGSTGATGTSGASFFESVSEEKDKDGNVTYIVITVPDNTPDNIEDNTEYRIPTAFTIGKLEVQVTELNSNVAALQTAVAALENNDYVTAIEDVKDDAGNVIGYKLTFAKSGEKVIYHGEKGDKGEDAVAPRVQINPQTNEWEISTDGGQTWTSTGVSAVGPKGDAGVTPKFKIENGMWYVSYDNGTTWSDPLGQATGNTGATGTSGASFFESVSEEKDEEGNITYIVIVVPDDTPEDYTDNVKYRIPTAFTFAKLEAQVSQLNSNVAALQTAVVALENNDYVTDIADIIDNEGNVIGYKLTFAKSGEKVIYHGEKGDKGDAAVAPRVQINPQTNEWEISTDGGQTWTSTGVSAVGPKGDAGATPKFKIENGEWYVSYDNGTTWSESLGQATGDKGETGSTGTSGASFFESVTDEKDSEGNVTYIVITVPDDNDDPTDNVQYRIPTAFTIAKLEAQVSQLNSNVEALQAAVTALENNDYVVAIEDVEDAEGNVIGYKLTFAKSGEKTIYHGAKGDKGDAAVAPRVQINPQTNEWEISTDGGQTWTSTGVSAVGPKGDAGATPKFKIENGEWYVSYDNGTTWSESLGQATGDKGETGSTGTSGASFFESVTDEKDSEGNVTYIVITVPDDNDDPTDNVQYRIPTAFTIARLEAQVSQLNSNVEALQAAVTALENNDYVTAIEDVKDDAGNVIGYKLTFAKSGEKTIYHGAKGDKGEDAVAPRVQINPQTNEWEISTDGGENWVSTKVVAVGPKGEDGATPTFKIENGQWYVSFNEGETWSESLGQATGDKGETGSTGTSGASFFESVTDEKDSEGNVTYIVITVPDDNDDPTDNVQYRIPTAFTIAALEARVSALEANIETIDKALSGLSFIKSIEPVYDNDTNKNIIGFKVKFVTLTGDVANNNASFVEDQEFTIYTASNYVVPVKEGDVWYWYANGTKLCAIDGTFVPEIVLDGGYIYVSKPGAGDFATDKEAADFADKWYKLDDDLTDDNGTFGSYVDEGTYYEITFPGSQKPIEVPKYYQTPVITFSLDGTTTITDLNIGGESSMDVTCTITGSFPDDDNHPKIYAACEGHFTSSIKSLNRDSNTQYTVVITVKPTTAYDTELNGKLTVYCPYYGNTGIGQLNLTAQGAGIKIESVEKSGNDLNATISLDGIVENSGEKLQVKVVGGDFDPKDPWISMGGVSNPSNSKIEQTLNLTPYVIGSQEDLEKGQVRQERTCTLAVVTPSGREAGYVAINQTPIINLADQGSANCYIISAPGRYMLPAREGNGGSLWSKCPSNVSVIKTSTDDNNNTVDLDFSLLEYEGEDYIVFDVPNAVKNGNTVIALKEGNTILWSWHLWFCKDESRPDNNLNTYVNGNNTYTVMNRAIGATKTMTEYLDGSTISVWTDGLYYQWGRKDPFLVNEDGALVGSEVASSGTYNSSTDKLIYNSNWTSTDGWRATKSKNDPCPPGYRVPNNSIWKDKYEPGTLEKAANAIGVFSYNLESTTDLTKAINYSYSSYIQSDGSLKKDEKEFVPFETGYSFTSLGQEGTIPVKLSILGTYDFPKLAEDKFTMNNMKIQVTRKEGRLWGLNSSNSSYLYYYGKVLGLDELTDEAALEKILQIGEYTHERRVVTNYSLSGLKLSDLRALLSSLRNGSLSEEFLESIAVWGTYNTVTPNMSNNDKSALLAKLLLSANDDINTYDHTKVTTNINPAEASQIRCIKE